MENKIIVMAIPKTKKNSLILKTIKVPKHSTKTNNSNSRWRIYI